MKIIKGIIGAAQGLFEFSAFYMFLLLFAEFLDRMGQE